MPLDANIILQGRGPQIENPLDVQNKALTMKQLARQGQMQDRAMADDDAYRSSIRRNTITDENGQTSINKKGVLSDLYKSNPEKAMAFESQSKTLDFQDKEQQFKVLEQQTKTAKQLAFSITDAASYEAARQRGIQLGLPNSDKLPAQYDPTFVKRMQMGVMSAEETLAQRNKDREFSQREQHEKTYRQDVATKGALLSAEKVDKLAKEFKKDMDPDSSRTGNFGQISQKVQSAERLEGLVGAFHDGNLPPAQVEEMALGMANMISGSNGGAARAQVEALVPHSAMGDAQKFKSWLMNEPYGANQQKFVEMMSHTIAREKGIANDQLNGIRLKRLSTHERFKKSAPDQYNRMLADYGINQGKKKEDTAGAGQFHDLSDDDLDKAYKAAGGQ